MNKTERAAAVKKVFRGMPKRIEIGCIICWKEDDYNICTECGVQVIIGGHNCNDPIESAIKYVLANFAEVKALRKSNKL